MRLLRIGSRAQKYSAGKAFQDERNWQPSELPAGLIYARVELWH